MIDLASTGRRRLARLDNKLKQKYGLFYKLSLAVVGSCELAKSPHIFPTRSKQYTQEIKRNSDGTLNQLHPMLFAENQEQNEFYIFNGMLLQPYMSYFILAITNEVEANKARSHWILMKNIEVNNKHKNKDGKIKTILSIWYF